jgi:hypothetical protein
MKGKLVCLILACVAVRSIAVDESLFSSSRASQIVP